MTKSCVVIHLPKKLHLLFNQDGDDFYSVLYRGFRKLGVKVENRARKSVTDLKYYEPENFHFVHQSRLRSSNILNTGSTYLRPFHYVDSTGVFLDSSMAMKTFKPSQIPVERSEEFFAFLQKSQVQARKSKYRQPEEVANFKRGGIGVFLQGWSEPMDRARLFTEIEMLDIICSNNQGRQIIVKHHPRNFGIEVDAHLKTIAKGRDDIKIVDAHVHDILAAIDVCCTVSSGVGMESMLHKTPVILFGKTDYEACTYRMQNAGDFPNAIQVALKTEYPYEAFLTWFLRRNCVNPKNPNVINNILKRMDKNGFDISKLGLAL